MSLPGRLRDPLARALRNTVLAPFLSLQQQIERLSASLARYDAVVAQRDSAALAATFLPELRSENTRLRSLLGLGTRLDRKSTRLNSSHVAISYAVFCLKKKKKTTS